MRDDGMGRLRQELMPSHTCSLAMERCSPPIPLVVRRLPDFGQCARPCWRSPYGVGAQSRSEPLAEQAAFSSSGHRSRVVSDLGSGVSDPCKRRFGVRHRGVLAEWAQCVSPLFCRVFLLFAILRRWPVFCSGKPVLYPLSCEVKLF
jgi:hypothetical protein